MNEENENWYLVGVNEEGYPTIWGEYDDIHDANAAEDRLLDLYPNDEFYIERVYTAWEDEDEE